jgi:hypothetical protein
VIAPTPTLPENITIIVVFQGATLLSASAWVQSDGTFSYLALCGAGWSMGYYTIVATDAHGTTGSVTFEVMM